METTLDAQYKIQFVLSRSMIHIDERSSDVEDNFDGDND